MKYLTTSIRYIILDTLCMTLISPKKLRFKAFYYYYIFELLNKSIYLVAFNTFLILYYLIDFALSFIAFELSLIF